MNGLKMGADRRENIIWRAERNVKTYFIDFVDENTYVDDDDDYAFASMGNRDWVKKNQS
jgi:hypothetical protein